MNNNILPIDSVSISFPYWWQQVIDIIDKIDRERDEIRAEMDKRSNPHPTG